MPQQHNTTFDEVHELTVPDQYGSVVLTVTVRKITIIDPNGATRELHQDAGIQLVDGLFWTPQMLRAATPILLTVCPTCRNPPASLFRINRPTHGLLSVRNARVCSSCGTVTCPSHRRWIDGQWFCRPCCGQREVRNVIHSLLFREVD